MISLAQEGKAIWRRSQAVLLLIGVTLIIWGIFILSFVFIYQGLF
ncbi:hypothetical protein [Roseimarinus sediminis]